jgi:hypothetical protein
MKLISFARSIVAGVSLGFGLLTWTCAFAGVKVPVPVYFTDYDTPYGQSANGVLGSARNSSDPNESIGCYVYNYGSGAFGYCSAVDSNGVIHACSAWSAEMLATMRALSSDSFLSFSWDGLGNCLSVEESTMSYYELKIR